MRSSSKARLERLEGRRAAAVRRIRCFMQRPRGADTFVEANTGKTFTRAELDALRADDTLILIECIYDSGRNDDAAN